MTQPLDSPLPLPVPLPGTHRDDDARTRRLVAARRWNRRAEQAARRAARLSSAVR
jgi:hypothetical protein